MNTSSIQLSNFFKEAIVILQSDGSNSSFSMSKSDFKMKNHPHARGNDRFGGNLNVIPDSTKKIESIGLNVDDNVTSSSPVSENSNIRNQDSNLISNNVNRRVSIAPAHQIVESPSDSSSLDQRKRTLLPHPDNVNPPTAKRSILLSPPGNELPVSYGKESAATAIQRISTPPKYWELDWKWFQPTMPTHPPSQ
jgi:hypothetical protein